MENQLDPAPDQINIETGKSMWILDGYRVWATNYQEALVSLARIKLF